MFSSSFAFLQPPKSAAGRRGIAIDAGTIDMLRAHRGNQLLCQIELGAAFVENGLVFPGPFGELMDPSVLTRNFEKVVRKAGYPGLRLHDLRHGHAAGLIRSGAYPLVVQERLGHASPAFTMQVYGHVSAGMQEAAANAFAELMGRSKDRKILR
ncbi:MAG: tyrosine-type recombinase/integrase [Chloroflexi bacterium]|nr:tyrosine-type recombinase/integrase [Chloroflexota bacterium]